MADHLRARIFVDFWNLTLSCRDRAGRDYRLDWLALSPCLIAEAQSLLGIPLRHDGTNVYLSYDPKAATDKNLHRWATTVLDRFPGIRVMVRDRKAKNPPDCPVCHQTILSCPHCGAHMAGTIEKGIDTAIVTDMISLAWEGAWDVAILVSSDRDFIPAVEFLTVKGRRVINAHFPPLGMDLARACWASIDLVPHMASLARA
jgi:uncharacterized LabA/DUF88 family protein